MEYTTITDEERYNPKNYLTIQQHRQCQMCGKNLGGREFYMFPNGKQNQRAYICANCMATTIDIAEPSTFSWFCQYFDMPLITETVKTLVAREIKEKAAKTSTRTIMGKYIRQMKTNQFGGLYYSDTPFLNLNCESDLQELINREYDGDWSVVEDYEKKLKERYASGVLKSGSYNVATLQRFSKSRNHIDKAVPDEEFKKIVNKLKQSLGIVNDGEKKSAEMKFILNSLDQQISAPKEPEEPKVVVVEPEKIVESPLPPPPPHNAMTNSQDLISSQLTDEDITYLTSKWGASYTPADWIKMEEIYNSYVESFDMTIDREETLKKLVRTSIKMDAALESDNTVSFKALSAVYDQLRKSGKFTDSQKQEEKDAREIDSIGELVSFVEKEGDVIPPLPEEEYEQDKLDLIIKDMQAYTYNLLKNEMGLSDLIESYIKKLEEIERESKSQKNLTEGLITSEADLLKAANEEIDDPWARKLSEQDFSTQDLLDTF